MLRRLKDFYALCIRVPFFDILKKISLEASRPRAVKCYREPEIRSRSCIHAGWQRKAERLLTRCRGAEGACSELLAMPPLATSVRRGYKSALSTVERPWLR